jgi:DNA-binding MarR family transcriptional regulator
MSRFSLTKEIVVGLMQSNNSVMDELSKTLKPFGISIQQFNVLRILRGEKTNNLNLNEITHRMIHKMSNTTRLVDKLIDKSLVERIVCPENRRRVNISITDKGLALLSKTDALIEQTEKKATCMLTEEEKNNLLTILNKIKSQKNEN